VGNCERDGSVNGDAADGAVGNSGEQGAEAVDVMALGQNILHDSATRGGRGF